jgi:5-methylcytosine-specific restriction endonuclease McrA
MDSDNPRKNDHQADRLIAETRRQRAAREKEYREQALRLFPHICARCGREFAGKKLRELTVHHKDHNHDNNPQDGSNWELLCLYCHDNEHQKYLDQDSGGPAPEPSRQPATTFKPFAGLQELLKGKKKGD